MKSPMHLPLLIAILLLPLHLRAQELEEFPPIIDLDFSVRNALRHNFSIRQAKAEVERLAALSGEQAAAFIPKINVVGDYSRIEDNRIAQTPNFRLGTSETWGVEVQIVETVFLGGQDIALYRRARALRAAAQFALAGVVNDVLFNIKSRYYAALLAKAQAQVQQMSTALLEEELRIERDRLRAGTVSDFNVLRAEVEVANSKAPLIRANNDVSLSVEELTRVIGRHPVLERGVRMPSVEGTLPYELYEIGVEEALSTALTNRPELLQLQSLVDAETQGIWAARSAYLPQVDLLGGLGREKNQFEAESGEDLEGWRFVLSGRWNLFDGFATSERVNQARAVYDQQRLALDEARLRVAVEVRRSHASMMSARELVQASRQVVKQGEESLRLAKARYSAGIAPQIDVLDSQVALTQARTNEVLALHDYNLTVAGLQRAMGSEIRTPQPTDNSGQKQ